MSLRYHGTVNKEYCYEISYNGRIDTLQAAILLKCLDRLDQVIARRRETAKYYDERLKSIVAIPEMEEGYSHVYYTYTVRASRRDELKSYLDERAIETKIQHPVLMPHQPVYVDTARGTFPNAEEYVKQILCLPCFLFLFDWEVLVSHWSGF